MGRIKNWKIVASEKDIYINWFNTKSNKAVRFEQYSSRYPKYRIELGYQAKRLDWKDTVFGGLLKGKNFFTKESAMKYAIDYMKKHPKG